MDHPSIGSSRRCVQIQTPRSIERHRVRQKVRFSPPQNEERSLKKNYQVIYRSKSNMIRLGCSAPSPTAPILGAQLLRACKTRVKSLISPSFLQQIVVGPLARRPKAIQMSCFGSSIQSAMVYRGAMRFMTHCHDRAKSSAENRTESAVSFEK